MKLNIKLVLFYKLVGFFIKSKFERGVSNTYLNYDESALFLKNYFFLSRLVLKTSKKI